MTSIQHYETIFKTQFNTFDSYRAFLYPTKGFHDRVSQEFKLAKDTADTAAAQTWETWQTIRGDELEKLRLTHKEEAQRKQANAAKSEDTISKLKMELEKLRAAAGSETAAKAEQTQKWEAGAAQAQDTISKLQTELQTLAIGSLL